MSHFSYSTGPRLEISDNTSQTRNRIAWHREERPSEHDDWILAIDEYPM